MHSGAGVSNKIARDVVYEVLRIVDMLMDDD